MPQFPNTLESINRMARTAPQELVRLGEARFERALDEVVARVTEDRGREIVMLAGPSGSGKTTAARKLAGRFRALGMQSDVLSLDDFYLDRDAIPCGANGKPDYESVYALDLPLLQAALSDLLAGRKAEIPAFDFTAGHRSAATRTLQLGEQDAVIVEGLHALNPLVTAFLPHENVLKLYLRVARRICKADGTVLLRRRELRLIRRLLRDRRDRASSAAHTLSLWDNVLLGEQNYLLPFRAGADLDLDSTFLYEPCVFAADVLDFLAEADLPDEARETAGHLSDALRCFVHIEPACVPESSLLREFLGRDGLRD